MTPEEQNTVDVSQQTNNYLQRKLGAWKQRKHQTDSQYSNQQEMSMENDTMNLYENSLTATDKQTKQKYDVASRLNLTAEMINNVSKEKGYELTGNAYDIVDSYLQGFPEHYQAIYDFTRGDQDPEDFAVQMGWMEKPENDSNMFVNALGGAVESVLGIPKFLAKGAADVAGWSIKTLGGDEQRADNAVETVKGAIDKIGFGDEESTAYQATNVVGDIAQLFVPIAGEAKALQWGAKIITKYPKLGRIIGLTEQTLQKSPTLSKLIQLGGQGAVDTVKYNAINQEYTSPEELAAGSLLNIAFGKGGEVISKAGGKALDTLGIKGIMNTSKAKKAIEAIQKEGGDSKTIEDLAAWFNARGFKGTKDEIVVQLENHGNDARKLKLELLQTSNNKYKSEEATEILNKLLDYYKGSVGQKADYDRISKLIKKGDMYTPSELDNIQHELGQSPLNPFKESKIGETKDAKLSDILGKDYNKVKKLIEDIGEKEGLGNIKALNNEIVVANKVKDGILNKSMAEEIANGLKGYALPGAGALMGYLVEGDMEGALKRGAGTYGLKLLNSTPVRTYVSSAIQKLKGTEKVNLTKWLKSNGEQKLTDADSKVLARILEEAEGDTRNEIINTIINTVTEGARLGTVVGGAEMADYISENKE